MNLDELRSVQAKERRKDSLQHLRDAFYDDVAAYIADLRAARDRRAEQVEKPFSDDDVRRMSDEIETAEEVAEALYERRVGKVVKLASFAAADMPVETEGMTSQERELFDDLVSRISENKSAVLDVLAGDVPPATSDRDDASEPDSPETTSDEIPDATPPDTAAPDTAAHGEEPHDVTATDPTATDGSPPDDPQAARDGHEDGGALADAMGASTADDAARDVAADEARDVAAAAGSTEPSSTDQPPDGPVPVDPEPAPPGAPAGDADGPADTPTEASNGATGQDRTTVRITADVGEIFGVDEREYDLASEDVVTLPSANAEPLVRRDAAERID